MPPYLGLDFGGTKLAARFADETGRLVAFARCPTDPAGGADAALATMRALADELGAGPPRAVGISFGGPVNQFGTSHRARLRQRNRRGSGNCHRGIGFRGGVAW